MDAVIGGYRQSHISKGADYHADFQRLLPRSLSWEIERRILRKIVKRFLANRSIEYLDFACGTGRILAYLEDHVTSATGIDVSPSMLQEARKRVSQAAVVQSDITRDQVLKEPQFDLITAFRFFPNAEPQLRREALDALICCLKENGFLVLNNHRSTTFLRSRLARLVTGGRRGNCGMAPQEVHDLTEGKSLELVATYHLGIAPECETRPFKPRWLVRFVEEIGTRLPLASIASNIIYVYRRC